MKKLSLIILSAVIVVSFNFSACAGSNATAKNENTIKTKVDIDLTKLKGNMLYSQITTIVDDYEQYLGKTIRFIGKMGIIDGENRNYYTVSAGDASACCNTPLEFVLKGGSTDKKDYPEAGNTVRITGKLETYQEGKQTYLHLVDSEIYVYKY